MEQKAVAMWQKQSHQSAAHKARRGEWKNPKNERVQLENE